MKHSHPHSFHIPVLGIGYSIDTPVKVAHLGISSVISLLDDILMEKLREFYSRKFNLPYQAISDKIEDFRAERITAYLNMVDSIVREKFEELKASYEQKTGDFQKYMELMPDSASLKVKFEKFRSDVKNFNIREWIQENLVPGEIDVNIMAKVDKENYRNNQKLPVEYNDGHAALRGFVNSKLKSSVVLSAGMNPRLYNYLEKFDAFYPDEQGRFEKKITLKVSDYRSALIQGKYLAKKGLWVSEYRIESGLNCGGHAFATQGYLLGPVLEEMKQNREDLVGQTFKLFSEALFSKKRVVPSVAPEVKVTAQGGVGTYEEHDFLLSHYGLDSVGWGTPFLLVPEAVNIDMDTLDKLKEATEEDLYTSNISPLGVPFNNLRGNTKDLEKEEFIRQNKPGNPCSKKYAALNNEFGEKTICTASRKYQKLKLEALKSQNLPEDEFKEQSSLITDKSCICVGLGTSALIVNNLSTKAENPGVSVCPGPNMAYFSSEMTLKELVDHIYGRINVIRRNDRPHIFLKELGLYIDHLKEKVREASLPLNDKQREYFSDFSNNLDKGIQYYRELFTSAKSAFRNKKNQMLRELDAYEKQLKELYLR